MWRHGGTWTLKLKMRGWHWLIAYVDVAVIAALCVVFAAVAFTVPLTPFSPPQTMYIRLFASILLGAGISLAIFIIIDAVYVWPHEHLEKPLSPKHSKQFNLGKPSVRPLSEAHAVAFISQYRRLRRLSEQYGYSLSKEVLKANETLSPYRLAAKGLFYTLIAFLICTPVSLFFAFAVNPACLLVMAAPALPLVYPRFRLKSAAGDRKRIVDDELPFFVVYAGILQSVGVNLYNALLQIIGEGVFRQIEKDALIIKRNVAFFFRSPVEALEEVGKTHPNEKMKTLLLGYTSEWRSGGDLAKYLEAKAEDCLKDMQFKWKSYGERAGDTGEAVVSLLFVLPLMVLMSAFVFPSQAFTLVGLVTAVVVPLVSVAVFGFVDSSQPKTYDILHGDLRLSVTAGAVTLAASVLLGTPLWLSLAATLAAASTFYGAAVFLQIRENHLVEKSLPHFLRDVTEYRKMGYDITRAVGKISDENTYSSAFDSMLLAATRQTKLGVRMAEVVVPTRSWLTRICFFLLTQIVESGGGTASSMEKLTDFVNQVARTKRETAMSMRLYQALGVFTPVGLSLITALMFTLITAFASSMAPGAAVGILGAVTQVPQGLVDMSYLLVLASSACVALLTSKTVDLTAKNTLWITINMALAAGSIVMSTQLATLLLHTFHGML